jgi:hypothetical protein
MSTQYGAIDQRRTVQVPMWVAGLLAMIVVALIATVVVERGTGSTAARTVGAVQTGTFPGALETSGFARPAQAVTFPGALETSGLARPAQAVTFPGARETAGFPASAGAPQQIVVNGTVCHQCM